MKENTLWLGLDVHAETIAVAVADVTSVQFVGTIPNTPEDVRKLVKKFERKGALVACYEAGPCGLVLFRQLSKLGVDCTVVAPSKIPQRPGDLVKTDRRDALKLAELHRAKLLTPSWVPNEADEARRDLVRAREATKKDELRARHRVSKLLLRHGLRRPQKCQAWGTRHLEWLEAIHFEEAALDTAFRHYLNEVRHQMERVAQLERSIDETIATMPEIQQQVITALQTMRGIAKLTAVTLVTEIGSFSRFTKASELMAYVGMVPREYSSGKSRSQSGITKTGNAHVRRVICESAWSYRFRPALVAKLKARNQACESVSIKAASWRAQHRLHSRYRNLAGRGKPLPKVLCAVGRELIGFVWAVAKEVEQQHAHH
jgi:transposase